MKTEDGGLCPSTLELVIQDWYHNRYRLWLHGCFYLCSLNPRFCIHITHPLKRNWLTPPTCPLTSGEQIPIRSSLTIMVYNTQWICRCQSITTVRTMYLALDAWDFLRAETQELVKNHRDLPTECALSQSWAELSCAELYSTSTF
jgi:hypothetical protein